MRAVCLAVLAVIGLGLPLAAAWAVDEAVAPTPSAPREKLRVAAMPLAAILEWDGPRPTGVAVDVWDKIAGQIGVDTEFVRVNTIAEMLGSVRVGGTADVALGPVAITESRERVVDLTHAISHSGLRIAVRQRAGTGFTDALASFLSWRVLQLLAAVLALAVASGHLLWWFERGGNPRSFPPDYPRGVFEAIWWIASTIVTGGCDDKHVDSPLGRGLAFAWMIGGIVLLASFTSVLTAEMTVERVTGSIQGPRDIAGRTVGCQEGFVGVDSVRERGGTAQEFANLAGALDALGLGMIDAVVAENHQLMHAVNRRPRADIRLVGPIFDSFDYGFAVPTGSPLRKPMNTAILQMREDGVLDRILAQWLGHHD
jgi:ABC-type amino acid transport substrate-binding protein